MANKPFDLDKIREDPADHYDTPHDVMNDTNLTPENQSEILKAWEDDVRALSGKIRGSFFDEMRNPFLEILAGEAFQHFFIPRCNSFVQRLKLSIVYLLFHHRHRPRRHIIGEIIRIGHHCRQ